MTSHFTKSNYAELCRSIAALGREHKAAAADLAPFQCLSLSSGGSISLCSSGDKDLVCPRMHPFPSLEVGMMTQRRLSVQLLPTSGVLTIDE